MNATEQFLNFIQFKGGQITLGDIAKTSWIVEYRKHFSLLRKQGWTVTCEIDREKPSNNRYLLIPPTRFEGDQALMF